jgi:hypothetical protein
MKLPVTGCRRLRSHGYSKTGIWESFVEWIHLELVSSAQACELNLRESLSARDWRGQILPKMFWIQPGRRNSTASVRVFCKPLTPALDTFAREDANDLRYVAISRVLSLKAERSQPMSCCARVHPCFRISETVHGESYVNCSWLFYLVPNLTCGRICVFGTRFSRISCRKCYVVAFPMAT